MLEPDPVDGPSDDADSKAIIEHMTLTNVLIANYTLITQTLCIILYLIVVNLLK